MQKPLSLDIPIEETNSLLGWTSASTFQLRGANTLLLCILPCLWIMNTHIKWCPCNVYIHVEYAKATQRCAFSASSENLITADFYKAFQLRLSLPCMPYHLRFLWKQPWRAGERIYIKLVVYKFPSFSETLLFHWGADTHCTGGLRLLSHGASHINLCLQSWLGPLCKKSPLHKKAPFVFRWLVQIYISVLAILPRYYAPELGILPLSWFMICVNQIFKIPAQ